MGDAHTTLNSKRMCPRCTDNCYTIPRFIQALAKYHSSTHTQLDVFLESFAPQGDTKSKFVRKQMTEIVKKNTASTPLLMFNLRKEFAREMYLHDKRPHSVRYHYIDVRLAPFLDKTGISLGIFLILTNFTQVHTLNQFFGLFLKSYPTWNTFRKELLHQCFTSKDPDNKIVKQYRKLSESEKKRVKEFIECKITSVGRLFPYSSAATIASCFFWSAALLNDCYTICRFLRFIRAQSVGSSTIIFAGAGHTWNILQFLTGMIGYSVVMNNHPTKFMDVITETTSQSKCVHIKDE